MGDQQRWFKLWCSAPDDDDLQALPPATRWAWAAFGAYTKLHGTRGRVTITDTNAALAGQLGVPLGDLFKTIRMLPHMTVTCVTEPPFSVTRTDYGKLTVTWDNWPKYQEDSTQAERQRRSRSKKRGEEKRGEASLTHRAMGTNPRARGTNPRALGTNPRALEPPPVLHRPAELPVYPEPDPEAVRTGLETVREILNRTPAAETDAPPF